MGNPVTSLAIGETVTMHVWAWINDPCGYTDNGLDTWQMDIDVNANNVFEIVDGSIDLKAPSPIDTFFSGFDETSLNDPITGEVREVTVTQDFSGSASNVGVGGYSEIYAFDIEALAVGTAVITLKDDGGGVFYGGLENGEEFDNDPLNTTAIGGVDFIASASDNVITVLPEPATIALLALGGFVIRSRKK